MAGFHAFSRKALSLFLHLLVFAHQCEGKGDDQPSVTTSSTVSIISSAATESPSSSSSSADQIWYIPLVGLDDDPGTPWGANASGNGGDDPKPLPIIIDPGKNTVANSSDTGNGLVSFSDAGSPPESNGESLFMHSKSNTSDEVVLGPNSSLEFSRKSSNGENEPFPTVPFGLNLGRAGVWNGSLTFGGSYDANRITKQSTFQTFPHMLNGNSTFLSTGKQRIQDVVFKHYTCDERVYDKSEAPFPYCVPGGADDYGSVILDFTNEAIITPYPNFCGQNVTLKFGSDNDATEFIIPLHSSLTETSERCIEKLDDADDKPAVVLGKPFFQAAYIYVSEDGMWIARANRWALPPKPVPFNPDARIPVPDEPTQPTTAPSPTSDGSRNINAVIGGTITISSVSKVMMICLVALFV